MPMFIFWSNKEKRATPFFSYFCAMFAAITYWPCVHTNLTSLSYFHFRKIHSFIGGFDTNESYKLNFNLKPD